MSSVSTMGNALNTQYVAVRCYDAMFFTRVAPIGDDLRLRIMKLFKYNILNPSVRTRWDLKSEQFTPNSIQSDIFDALL